MNIKLMRYNNSNAVHWAFYLAWKVLNGGERFATQRTYRPLTSRTPVSIVHKSIASRPVRVADGPITARYWFIKNASWDVTCNGVKCICDEHKMDSIRTTSNQTLVVSTWFFSSWKKKDIIFSHVTVAILWSISADDTYMVFFLFFSGK